jgi:hypothetical protein
LRGIAGVVPSIPRAKECRPGVGLRGLRELRGVCPYSFLKPREEVQHPPATFAKEHFREG